MLTDEQKYENKMKYLQLLAELDVDLTQFSSYLSCARVDFFEKPLLSYGENAYSGSLCEHGLKIFEELEKLTAIYRPGKYSRETLIKLALLKDLYRAELYESYNKNQKNETTGQWETVVGYRNKEIRPAFGDQGFGSYMIAKKFFTFSSTDEDDELIEAICHSSISDINMMDSMAVHLAFPLITIVNMAELAVLHKL